jgi:hypothetical protein
VKRYLILAVAFLSVSACGSPPTPTPDVIATQVSQAQAVAATLTAAAAPTETLTPTDTITPSPTNTPEPTRTPTSTFTPSPTLSPAPTPTRAPSRTPSATYTPTPAPGIGQAVRCKDLYEIVVLSELDFKFKNLIMNDPPKGAYGMVRFRLTNLQSSTQHINMFSGTFWLVGLLGGKWVAFTPAQAGPSAAEQAAGFSAWWDDLPPGIAVKTRAVFDVNPAATSWTFVFAPEVDLEPACEIRIPLTRSSTGTDGPTATATKKVASTPKATEATTSTPAMLLLADSQADFTGGQGQNSWEYLFSEGRDTFNWKQMNFDGSCYRAPFENEQLRICADHGAPGAGGDISWLYKAEASGKLVFKVTAKKTAAQGDDIEIGVYRHTNRLATWDLDQGDTQGIMKQVEVDANGGEMFFFTMQVSSTWREFKYDPTIFRVQVYLRQ